MYAEYMDFGVVNKKFFTSIPRAVDFLYWGFDRGVLVPLRIVDGSGRVMRDLKQLFGEFHAMKGQQHHDGSDHRPDRQPAGIG